MNRYHKREREISETVDRIASNLEGLPEGERLTKLIWYMHTIEDKWLVGGDQSFVRQVEEQVRQRVGLKPISVVPNKPGG